MAERPQIMDMLLLVLLGLAAGALTTLAGVGGGQLAILTIAAMGDPLGAIVVSAPALLVGNLHRAWTFRAAADRRLLLSFMAGALPASLVGGRLAADVPVVAIQIILVATTLLSLARAFGIWRAPLRIRAMAPAGVFVGLVSACSGTGLILAPILLAQGLTGASYLVTLSACASLLHVGRIAGYALGGLYHGPMLLRSAAMAAAIVAGNLVGERARLRLGERTGTLLEHGVLVTCVVLAVVGLR